MKEEKGSEWTRASLVALASNEEYIETAVVWNLLDDSSSFSDTSADIYRHRDGGLYGETGAASKNGGSDGVRPAARQAFERVGRFGAPADGRRLRQQHSGGVGGTRDQRGSK